MKQYSSPLLVALIGITSVMWSGCSKKGDSKPVTVPVLGSTVAATSITENSAVLGGTITSDGGSTVSARGVCFDTAASPTFGGSNITTDGSGIGDFTSSLTGLISNKQYFVRAYAVNSTGVAYGSEVSFTTLAPNNFPKLSATTAATNITGNTATSGGTTTGDGGSAIIERGVCWNTTGSPTIALSTKTSNGSGIGTFSSQVTGLSPTTTYKLRAYATNANGTAYGPEISFTTTDLVVSAPVLASTTTISNITSTTASSGGNVTSDGNAPVTARGICWSTSPGPTTALSTKTTNGTGTGSFSSAMIGLSGNTQYFVRSYATNSSGTGYGSEVSFTTQLAIGSTFEGGIVGYILQPGDDGYVAGQVHGLVLAAANDVGRFVGKVCNSGICGPDPSTVPVTSAGFGTGTANTALLSAYIENGANGSYTYGNAALKCSNKVEGGKDDWYLPSEAEMVKLWQNKDVLSSLTDGNYWTSTNGAANGQSVRAINFPTGTITSVSWDNWNGLSRAIRKF